MGGPSQMYMWTPIVTLSFIVLLPVFPAYLLFHALPSTGNVGGKLFQGLEIKLGGAFAGYFALVFLVLHTKDVWCPPPPQPSAYVWQISGQVVDSNGQAFKDQLDLKDFAISPATFSSLPGGKFELFIHTEPQDGGGTTYPDIVLSHGSYVPFPIQLDPAKMDAKLMALLGMTRDDAHRKITMEHIPLQNPPYNPAGPEPQRIAELSANGH